MTERDARHHLRRRAGLDPGGAAVPAADPGDSTGSCPRSRSAWPPRSCRTWPSRAWARRLSRQRSSRSSTPSSSPVIAALRLPFTLALSFVLVLVLDAVVLLLASKIDPNSIKVDSFGWALAAALVISAASVVLQALLGVNDEDTYMLRVIRRVARRQGGQVHTSEPGIVFLEIDGLALPVLARAMRDGVVPGDAPVAHQRHASAGRMGDRPELADGGQPGGDPARLKREHPRFPVGREGVREGDVLLLAGRTAPRSSGASRRATGC